MERYLFKLNVQPSVIAEQGDKTFTTLLPEKICKSYDNIFKQVKTDGNGNLSFQFNRDYKDILSSSEYSTLLEQTNQFINEYKSITMGYRNKEGLNYRQEFLDQGDELKEQRKALVQRYSVLSAANKRYSTQDADRSVESEYRFSIDSKVGIGIDQYSSSSEDKAICE